MYVAKEDVVIKHYRKLIHACYLISMYREKKNYSIEKKLFDCP